MNKFTAVMAVLAIGTTACTSKDNSAQGPGTTVTYETVAAGLIAYNSCDALLDNVKQEALTQVSAWGLEGDYGYSKMLSETVGEGAPEIGAGRAPVAAADGSASPDSAGAPPTTLASGVPGVDYSTTNVQESGVDEPDTVKTDGRTLYITVGNALRVVDVSGGTPALTTALALPSAANHQLLLDENRLLILSSGYSYDYYGPLPDDPTVGAAESGGASPGAASGSEPSAREPAPDTVEPTPPTTPETTIPGTTIPETTTSTTSSSTTTTSLPEPTTTTTQTPPPTIADPNIPLPDNATIVTTLDVADPSTPRLVSQAAIDGVLLDARMIEGIVRIVTRSQPNDLGFVYPTDSGTTAELRALKENAEIIQESSLDDWLPSVTVTQGPGSDGEPQQLVGCTGVSYTSEFSGFGLLSVSTLDIRGDATIDPSLTTSIQTDGENVYASAQNLYVATTAYGTDQPAATTAIHEFDLTNSGTARYLGSGSVRGTLLNQFAMSEHEGVLRVATTDWTASGTPAPAEPLTNTPIAEGEPVITSTVVSNSDEIAPLVPATESFVTTLKIDNGKLTQIGQVGGLGRGEQIRSVRFIGSTGYVVTFRQTDPLYVVDLSNPSAPTVVGELKIPGYSAYLHPVGEGRLVGIGQDATEQGQTTGLQVALFDVSNPADPQQIQKYTITDAYSDAETEHHAFLWWAPENLLVIPAEAYGFVTDPMTGVTANPFTGALGLNVTDGGISERGRIQHPDSNSGYDEYGYPYWDYGIRIQRALVVGDSILTVSNSGLGSNSLTDLAVRSWLPFS